MSFFDNDWINALVGSFLILSLFVNAIYFGNAIQAPTDFWDFWWVTMGFELSGWQLFFIFLGILEAVYLAVCFYLDDVGWFGKKAIALFFTSGIVCCLAPIPHAFMLIKPEWWSTILILVGCFVAFPVANWLINKLITKAKEKRD